MTNPMTTRFTDAAKGMILCLKYWMALCAMVWLIAAINPSMAQSEDAEAIKSQLNEALTTYLNGVKPPAGVDGNENTYTYQKALKINDTKSVVAPDGTKTLRVEGVAKAFYKSLHGSGVANVPFRAVLIPAGNAWTLKKLEWKNGDTMRYTSLLSQ